MTADFFPLQVLLLSVSGWLNREQQRTIEYLVDETRVLEEQLQGRKLRLNDDQRRRILRHLELPIRPGSVPCQGAEAILRD